MQSCNIESLKIQVRPLSALESKDYDVDKHNRYKSIDMENSEDFE